MDIVLYSTNCPKCKALEKKLNQKGIEYDVNMSVVAMMDLGIMEAPVLSIDGELLRFPEAIKWVNSQ